MVDVLYRYDKPTSQWVPVTNVNRIEASGGGDFFGKMAFPAISITPLTVSNSNYQLPL